MIQAGPPAEPRRLTHLVGGEWVEGDSDAGDVQSNNPAHLSHPVATYRQAQVWVSWVVRSKQLRAHSARGLHSASSHAVEFSAVRPKFSGAGWMRSHSS